MVIFIIQRRVNPKDEWKSYKKFDDNQKAWQSFRMLEKHRYSLHKGSNYNVYRMYDVVNQEYHYS